jgi:hypothetical protein
MSRCQETYVEQCYKYYCSLRVVLNKSIESGYSEHGRFRPKDTHKWT